VVKAELRVLAEYISSVSTRSSTPVGSHSLRNGQPYLDLEQYLRQGKTRVPCWVLLSSIGIIVLWQPVLPARWRLISLSPHRILALHPAPPHAALALPTPSYWWKNCPGQFVDDIVFPQQVVAACGWKGESGIAETAWTARRERPAERRISGRTLFKTLSLGMEMPLLARWRS
jgi:hypothetical protein